MDLRIGSLSKMRSIMFVCLGNICRSPIAEGCAKKLVQAKGLEMKISSSGTGNWHIGETPCDNSIKVCKLQGIDIATYKATQFRLNDVDENTLIVALDQSNVESLQAMGAKNIVKLGVYGYDSQDVPDPYFFNGFEGFDKVFTMIDECVQNLFEKEGYLS